MIKKEKHNYVGTSIYGTWYNMKSRCDNPTYTNFAKWGGRGISYDHKWRNFLAFLEDMGEKPEGTSLDRIDLNGNYCKDNCRWATRKEQMNNMSNNRKITFNNITKNLQEWATETGIKRETIARRLDIYKWTVEKTLTVKPTYNHGNHNYYR